MPSHAVLPRILGALFYYSPDRPEVQPLLEALDALPALYPWQDRTNIADLCAGWRIPDKASLLWQFSVLFEGQGEMAAPPWGSVYLEKDNLLMGETTAGYRAFLQREGKAFDSLRREPEDQFGLMLLAYSAFLDEHNNEAATVLMTHYLLPWAPRYLQLLQENKVSPFYSRLAQVAQCYIAELGYLPVAKRLFF